MSLLRIVIAASTIAAGAGGISRVSRMMCRTLAEREDLDVRVLTLEGDRAAEDLGVPCEPCGGSKMLFALRVRRLLLRGGVTIYDHVGLARAHPRWFPANRPYATWIHGVEIWERARPEYLAPLRRANRVFVNSHYTLKRAERLHGDLPSARVCWLATEEDASLPADGDSSGPPTVLVLARMDPGGYKGHQELIDAWPSVISVVPDARLLVVGGGDGAAELRERARDRGVALHVEFAGFVPDEEMDAVWSQADILAMPSRGEGFGLVYVEAMRRGIPVIASSHDAASEVVLDQVTGLIVDLDKPAGELPAALGSLLRDPVARRRLGAAGRSRWEREFRFSAFRSRFEAELGSVLSGVHS